MSDLVGKRLGQYDILNPIGQGGMATVYKARQESMERDVAVKVIIGQLATNPDFIARFEREARLIAKLQHPHILPVYDFGRDENLLYLVMRLVEGGSLDQRLTAGALPINQALRMFTQVASALTYAHDLGIIHRDLKPNNILLDKHDNPYLTDFGIAKIMADRSGLTATGAVMGTPSYMAPEQWRGDSVDARTDVYALGCMLYEMLTGDLPFKGDTPFALMYKHFDSMPPSPRTINPDIPDAVGYVISRAIAKDQEERYPSADEMAEDLSIALGGTSFNLTPRSTGTMPVVTPSMVRINENDATFIDDAPNKNTLLKSTNMSGKTVAPRGTGRLNAGTTIDEDSDAPVEPVIPAAPNRLPLIIGGVVALLIVVGAGLFLASQNSTNANATATQVALIATNTQLANTQLAIQNAASTQAAIVAATGTALAMAPTATPLPTQVRFTDFADQVLNVKFRQPASWEVQKTNQNNIFVTEHFKDLSVSSNGIVTGPPYILIIVGSSQDFGALDMATSTTAMDALTAMLGGERITNLDPVFGTHFPAATTTRPNTELGVLRVIYLLMLGPDRFAVVLLQTKPDVSELFNDTIALPLVRSFDFAILPTEVAPTTPTPTPPSAGTFAPPTTFDKFHSDVLSLDFEYPKGWKILQNAQGQLLITTQDSQVDVNNVNSDPYILIIKRTRQDLQILNAQYSIADIFRDNFGSLTVNPRELQGMPYPSAVGRSLGQGTIKVNGWIALTALDNDNFLMFLAQSPRGSEPQYLNGVLTPLIKSLKFTTVLTTALPDATATP
jgi:serine/threonine protein kinase